MDQSLFSDGLNPQWFHARACPQERSLAANTSRRFRYLDSWAMSAARCSQLLELGTQGANLAIAVGEFETPEAATGKCMAGGNLTQLALALKFLRILVLDAEEALAVQLPSELELDGVFLVANSPSFVQAATERLRKVYRLPIIGQKIGDQVSWNVALQSLFAAARDFELENCRRASEVPCRDRRRWPLRIGIAIDEAFNGYFPETLACLQSAGASFHDFSPLRNDCLPNDVDVVYLGDGPVEDWLEPIAANHCFLHRLAAFASRGGKVIAEGRAAVCLCREARTLKGRSIPLAAVLPTTAEQTESAKFLPISLPSEKISWLAPQGTLFQGYAPQQWRITSEEPDSGFADLGRVLMRGNVIALPFSQHWASRPDLLRSLFRARGRRLPDEATV